MNSFASVIFLGLLAIVAANVDFTAIEQEIASAPFVDVELPQRRIKNHISNACKCDEKNVCECCATPVVFGLKLKGCAKFAFDAAAKDLGITVTFLDNVIVDTTFSTKKLEKICGNLPGKANILGFCLTTETTETEEEGLLSCSTLDITFKSAEAGKVTFACLNIKDGKVSIKAADGPLKIQVKNPLKVVVDLISKVGKKPASEA